MKKKILRFKGLTGGIMLVFSLFTFLFPLSTVSYAAHPLVTDDTGTQGKGKFQLEVNSAFTFHKEREDVDDDGLEDAVEMRGGEIATVLTYGALENLDIFLEMPYAWSKTKVNGIVNFADPSADARWVSDIVISAKWRFYEYKSQSFGLKSSISLPTGDENKGLGKGRPSYALAFIATKGIERWAFHLNLGYAHNEYKLQAEEDANRKGIWHASLAAETEVIKDLKAVANIGTETNPVKTSSRHPAFVLGGLIYSVTENFDINLGVKGGLNKSETDLALLAGIVLRF